MTDKYIFRFVAGISVFVCGVVIILMSKVIPSPAVVPSFTHYLPLLNACLNGTCSVLLLISLYFIKRGNITWHKRINITAFCLSSLFLMSYILFHYLAPETRYRGSMRAIYLVILISHIILAATVLPLVLLSFYRGLQMQVEKHKKLVRWSYPIWLYVTVTGVIVYILISPYYRF